MSESGNDRRNDFGDGPFARLSSFLLRQMASFKRLMLKSGRYGKPRRMVLLEALQLGNRRQLFLVACDEHRFLVGAGSDRIGTLVAFPGAASEGVQGTESGVVKPRAGMQSDDAPRASERGREPASMRPAFASTAGRRLELVQRESVTASDKTARSGLEAGRTQ
jgi:flagellar biogenesis protein FliO